MFILCLWSRCGDVAKRNRGESKALAVFVDAVLIGSLKVEVGNADADAQAFGAFNDRFQ